MLWNSGGGNKADLYLVVQHQLDTVYGRMIMFKEKSVFFLRASYRYFPNSILECRTLKWKHPFTGMVFWYAICIIFYFNILFKHITITMSVFIKQDSDGIRSYNPAGCSVKTLCVYSFTVDEHLTLAHFFLSMLDTFITVSTLSESNVSPLFSFFTCICNMCPWAPNR